MSLIPSDIFLRLHPAEAEELRKARESAWFTSSSVFAISQMVYNGATQEQLSGAKQFVEIMQKMHEKPQPEKKMPPKTLDMDNPTKPLLATLPETKKK